MDCLIFGGYGYLGSRIFDHLTNEKWDVSIGTNNKTKLKINKLDTIYNYRNLPYKDLKVLIKKYDLIIDCSGISGPKTSLSSIPDIIKINTLWPCQLAEICVETNTRLVWFSTIHCEKLNIKNQIFLKENIYALSKYIVEKAIMEINGWENIVTIIRLGNMIGSPGLFYLGDSNLFGLDISKNLFLTGKATIKGNPNKCIAFIPISKLLRSNLLSLPGFYVLNSDKKFSLYSIAQSILKSYEAITNKRGEIDFQQTYSTYDYSSISKELKSEIDLMINFFKLKFDSFNN